MLDRFIYRFFAGIDFFANKLDTVFYAGHEKIRSFFKRKRKTK